MADVKISALTAVTATPPALTLQLPVYDGTNPKMMTVQQIQNALGIYTATLGSDHSVVTSVTGTKALFVSSLPIGKYWYEIYIIAKTSVTTIVPTFGVSFGTGNDDDDSTKRRLNMFYCGSAAGAANGTPDDVVSLSTGACYESWAQTAWSTTTPNLITTAFSSNDHHLFVIRGYLEVTTAGDFELWHGNETTGTCTTVIGAGTAMFVWRADV